MDNEQYMCYITYAVPAHMMPKLMTQTPEIAAFEPLPLYPPGFMPEWFRKSSFPEDEE